MQYAYATALRNAYPNDGGAADILALLNYSNFSIRRIRYNVCVVRMQCTYDKRARTRYYCPDY